MSNLHTARRLAAGSASDVETETEVRSLGLFGQYLTKRGVISSGQLERVLSYQRVSGLRIGEAAIQLGFASSDDIEWAALAYHGDLG